MEFAAAGAERGFAEVRCCECPANEGGRGSAGAKPPDLLRGAHMRAGHQSCAAVAVLAVLIALTAAQASPQDYPQWRGRNRDGEAAAFVPPGTWPNTLTLKWKVDVGPG